MLLHTSAAVPVPGDLRLALRWTKEIASWSHADDFIDTPSLLHAQFQRGPLHSPRTKALRCKEEASKHVRYQVVPGDISYEPSARQTSGVCDVGFGRYIPKTVTLNLKNFLVYYPGIFLARFEYSTAMLARHQQEHPAAPSVGKSIVQYSHCAGQMFNSRCGKQLHWFMSLSFLAGSPIIGYQGSVAALEAATIQLAVGLRIKTLVKTPKRCHNLKTYPKAMFVDAANPSSSTQVKGSSNFLFRNEKT